MDHQQAKAILKESGKPVEFSPDMDTVKLQGEYTIEELQALLQLMEYNA